MSEEESKNVSAFPRKKRPQLRQRRRSSGSDEEEEDKLSSAVSGTKEVQMLRRRQMGVTAQGLAEGKHYAKEKEVKKDPFKIAQGGFVDMKALKSGQIKQLSSLDDADQIGTSFAAETNRRDEDADMLKYVEQEMLKRKGLEEDDTDKEKPKSAEDVLYELPDNIKALTSHRKKNEDMLSNQMLSGIPEVELGIDEKIRNIEVTEEAKRKLLQERMNNRGTGVSDFVPTNMAVNFMQHNRFTIEDTGPANKKAEPAPKPAPARVGDVDRPPTIKLPSKRPGNARGEKATDDFHYEKFKKQLRRY